MKLIYLYRLLIFILLVWGLDKLFASYLDTKYKVNHKNYALGFINYFIDRVECDTIIIGSSKVQHDINPTILGIKTNNLALEGTHFIFHTALIDLLAKKNKLSQKVLILHLEPYEFDNTFDFSSEINRLKYFYKENKFIRQQINQLSFFEPLKYWMDCYRFNGYALDLLAKPIENIGFEYSNKGFQGLIESHLDSARIEETKKENSLAKSISFNNKRTIANLKKIIKICQKNHTKLICMTNPNYFNNKHAITNSRRLEHFLSQYKVPYLNFYTFTIFEFKDRTLWYDNIHLNNKGAQIFSTILKTELNKIKI